MNHKSWWSISLSMLLLLALATVGAPVSAGSLALPPRPTAVPTATPVPPLAESRGSVIRLVADTVFTSAWASVEWQDAAGNWHVVTGWQGTLEADQTKTWWVAEVDWGKGPFRWVLYDQRGGQSLGHSVAFHLPANHRQVVEIKLTAKR